MPGPIVLRAAQLSIDASLELVKYLNEVLPYEITVDDYQRQDTADLSSCCERSQLSKSKNVRRSTFPAAYLCSRDVSQQCFHSYLPPHALCRLAIAMA